MKIEREKNASRNIIFGMMLRIFQSLLPFVLRTFMLYYWDIKYLGLNGLFASVLQVLNLTELGVGSAMVFSMYKPVVEDDKKTICALLNLYRKYYTIIGGVVALIGMVISPFIPYLITGDIPDGINIHTLYFMHLATTVCTYCLYAYKCSLLMAHQRTDIISRVVLASSTIQYIIQIGIIVWVKNYYLFIICELCMQVINNVIIARIVNKMYPEYEAIGALGIEEKQKINQRIKDLFTAKFGSVVVGAVDIIVISAFLGLEVLTVYQNYYYIMNTICGFIGVVFASVIAGIGNSMITETKEKNFKDFRIFTFSICWLLCIGCCCLLCLYQPFMQLWAGESLMLDNSYVILFCILFYLLELSMVWATVKDAAGIWHSDRFRPLIGATFNLIINIILVRIIGLYGIILSTILSYIFISMPWLFYNIFRLIYQRNMTDYLRRIIQYVFVTVLSAGLCYWVCGWIHLGLIATLCVNFIICIVISNFLQILVLGRTEEYGICKIYLINGIKRILKR